MENVDARPKLDEVECYVVVYLFVDEIILLADFFFFFLYDIGDSTRKKIEKEK